MHQVTKRFGFEAAHQLLPGCFTSKCSDCVHGHSYYVDVTLQSVWLDDNGMVIDFGRLKEWIGYVMRDWDHACLLPPAIHRVMSEGGRWDQKKLVNFGRNPTAENMAQVLYEWLSRFVRVQSDNGFAGVQVHSVTVWETSTCSATYTGASI